MIQSYSGIFKQLEEEGLTVEEVRHLFTHPADFVEKFFYDPKGLSGKIKLGKVQRQMLMPPYEENFIRQVVINSHRRSGKSASCVFLALYFLLTRKNCQLLFISPAFSQVQAFFQELDRYIEFHPWIKECQSDRGNTQNPPMRTFTNGATIRGMSTGAKSSGKGNTIRGQGADIIFLDEVAYMAEEDFSAIKPIVVGDKWRIHKPIVYAVSTPNAAFGQFYEWFTTKNNDWNKIFLPITENPDWSQEEIDELRTQYNTREWATEFMCEFLNSGATVFPLDKVDSQSKDFEYTISSLSSQIINNTTKEPVKTIWRTIGVDWDKYNKDGAGPTIAVLECDETHGSKVARVIYKESIPQDQYSLTIACDRVIHLNNIMKPDRIYVDRGMGEASCEYLWKHGKDNPYTELDKKVKGIHFGQNVKIQDPLFGLADKKFKPFMVNLLVHWFENEIIEYPKSDLAFKEQLKKYRVVSQTLNNIVYSSDSEHIIDAVGLAAVAMYQIHKSPFRKRKASTSYMLPQQEVIAGEDLSSYELSQLKRRSPVTAALVVKKEHESNSNFLFGRRIIEPDTSTGYQEKKKIPTYEGRSSLHNIFERRLGGSKISAPSSRNRF